VLYGAEELASDGVTCDGSAQLLDRYATARARTVPLSSVSSVALWTSSSRPFSTHAITRNSPVHAHFWRVQPANAVFAQPQMSGAATCPERAQSHEDALRCLRHLRTAVLSLQQ